jgi:hypothetical protein
MQDRLDVRVTPTYLGRFEANAAMTFTGKMLEAVQNRSVEEIRNAFVKAYDLVDQGIEAKSALGGIGPWLMFGLTRPLELLNLRWPEYDFVVDVERAIKALDDLAHAETPLTKMHAFDRLLATNYPDRLARALLELATKSEVPRVVSFDTSARGPASPDVKQKFDSLRNKIFRSVRILPSLERSRVPLEKLKAFVPGEIRESRVRPVFRRIEVQSRKLTDEELQRSVNTLNEQNRHKEFAWAQESYVVCRVHLRNVPTDGRAKLYVKVSDSGRVQLGKFLLAERLFNSQPANNPDELGAVAFEFFLSGPLSVIEDPSEQGLFQDGSAYQVDISASSDGRVWSDEKNFRFTYFSSGLAPAP